MRSIGGMAGDASSACPCGTHMFMHQACIARVIAEIERIGFPAFADKHFDLIPRQQRELATIKDRDAEVVFTGGVLLALHRNGKLELIHEGHDPANLKMEIYCGGGECGVRITC